jgi:hypothetical protein
MTNRLGELNNHYQDALIRDSASPIPNQRVRIPNRDAGAIGPLLFRQACLMEGTVL